MKYMKFAKLTRVQLIIGLICLLFSCSADVNITKCEINVKQGNTDIPCKTGYFDFGNIPLHLVQTITFSVENKGTTNLNLIGNPKVEIVGEDASEFSSFSNDLQPIIAPGESSNFKINFHPSSIGNKKTTVQIQNDDNNENPYTFVIVGYCTPPAPEIHVVQDTKDILCSTGKYNFGMIAINTSSEKITFTIQNNGDKDLLLTGNPDKISKSGTDQDMFIIDQTNTISPVSSGNTTSFEIEFMPSLPGVKTATISILNNDSDENPYIFTVTGTGVTAPEINIKQGSDDIPNGTGKYEFASTLIYEPSGEVTFTIENLGSATLHLSDSPNYVKITGIDASMFTVNLTSTNDDIAPGSSTTFGIIFKPTSEGKKTAIVSIPNIDSDENPYTFTIEGLGIIYHWTKKFGMNSEIKGNANICDSAGNIYITGSFRKTVDFCRDFPGTDYKAGNSRPGIYVTKINANCTYAWTKTFYGPSDDAGYALAVDNQNNIYVTGYFSDVVNFGADFGVSDIKVSKGRKDIFVSKLTQSGGYEWTKRFGGSYDDTGYSITCDNSGNIAITGMSCGNIDFGEDFGVSDIKNGAGNNDIFVTKISSTGSYIWTRIFGNYSNDIGYDVETDAAGNVYVAGYCQLDINFAADFGGVDNKDSNGGLDIFLTKIKANGTYGWTRRIGGHNNEICYSMTIDSNGKIYLTGFFMGSVDFGADFGYNDVVNSTGSRDIFICKTTTSGSFGWTAKIGGSLSDEGSSITTDSSGNIFLTGYFESTVNFASDWKSSEVKTSSGYQDVFVTKLNSNGIYQWTHKIGGSDVDLGHSITIDDSGRVYIIGEFDSTVDFGSDFNTTDPKTAGSDPNVFLTKIVS